MVGHLISFGRLLAVGAVLIGISIFVVGCGGGGSTGTGGQSTASPSNDGGLGVTSTSASPSVTAASDIVGRASLGSTSAVDGTAVLQIPTRGKGNGTIWTPIAQTSTHQGYFRFVVAQVPTEFRVTVTGKDGTVLSSDRLSFDATHRQVILNAVSSLACLYRDRHPALAAAEVQRATRKSLGIPAYWDVDAAIDLPSSPFSHETFLQNAHRNGGVNNYLLILADQVDAAAGQNNRATPKLKAGGSIFAVGTFTLLGLAQGITGGISGHLFGSLLSSLGAGGVAEFLGLAQPNYTGELNEIVGLLQQVISELTTITTALTAIEAQLSAGQFATAVATLNTAYSDINNRINNPFFSIMYTTDQTHTYVMDNQQPSLRPGQIKDDLSSIHSTLVGTLGTNDFFTYYVQNYKQLTPTGYTTRSQWDTLLQQWYSQAWLMQVNALNALVEYYHYTAVPGANPSSGDPFRNYAAARDTLTVAYNLKAQEQRLLSLLEFTPTTSSRQGKTTPFLSQDVVRGLSINGLAQEALSGTVVSTTSAEAPGSLQITWTEQQTSPPLRAGMLLGVDGYAVLVSQVVTEEPNAQGQQIFVGVAPPSDPALPASFAAGATITGPGNGSLLSEGVVYDHTNNLLWRQVAFGPFDTAPTAGNYADPSLCSYDATPFYPSVPNLGTAATNMGDWITTQMSRTGGTGYVRPNWQLPSVSQLQGLVNGSAAGFLSNSQYVYCSDSSLSYKVSYACVTSDTLADQTCNNLLLPTQGTGSAALRVSSTSNPRQLFCDEFTNFPVQMTPPNGDCNFQTPPPQWVNTVVCSPATGPSKMVIRATDLNGVPLSSPFGFQAGSAYRLDLVATLADGEYSVGREALWSISGPRAFIPDGNFASAQVYINNLAGMEGCITILPWATPGDQYTITAQLGSTTISTTMVVLEGNYTAQKPFTTWNLVDALASLRVYKDTDQVSLKAGTLVNVSVIGRFRPAAMNASYPQSIHTMRSSDYSVDLSYQPLPSLFLRPTLQYVTGTSPNLSLKEAGPDVATLTYGGTNFVVQPVSIPSDAEGASNNRMHLVVGFQWTLPQSAVVTEPSLADYTQILVVKDP